MAEELARWDAAVDSTAAADASLSFLEAAYEYSGDAINAVTAEAVSEMLTRLRSDGYRWRAEVLTSLWCFGSAVGVWRRMAAGATNVSYDEKVAWEDRVEERVADGVGEYRRLVHDADPEVRSMAALVLSCSSTDAHRDFDLLEKAFSSESVELARACFGEATATLGRRYAHDADLRDRVERFLDAALDTQPDLVRFRIALAFTDAPANPWSDQAKAWERNADVKDRQTRWPCEV
ncbi:hypothetical protein [Stackebrandtia albiflava]|nr:hypothetical protein [Stackebrandtia albiflava]